MAMKEKKSGANSYFSKRPAENVIVTRWDQTPQQTRLRSDPAPISWPFGDDVAEVFETLDDAHFEAYCNAVERLCEAHARNLPRQQRGRFMAEQHQRIDGYRRARGYG